MDSLTQITLGAAVGEVVLGKKAGNRAMLWGAVAGTIPDFDVIANLVTDPVSALAYHRAFTHSITFAVATPLIFGLVVHRLYQGKQGPFAQQPWLTFLLSWCTLIALVFIGSFFMPLPIAGLGKIAFSVSSLALLVPLLFYLREHFRKTPSTNENPSWMAWSTLFFFSIITHPLLDACTTYGTQLLQPFSSLRVAWNSISVADPLYTLPFLIFLIRAARQDRTSPLRSRYNWMGIGVSSAYLLLSTVLMLQADKVLKSTIATEKLQATRSVVGPTILNSILWNGAVETDSFFHIGLYSFLDQEQAFQLYPIAKNHHLIKEHWNDKDVKILRWFSNGFFSVYAVDDKTLRLGDLRFGTMNDGPNQAPKYVFWFDMQLIDGELQAVHVQQGPEDRQSGFSSLFERIGGI